MTATSSWGGLRDATPGIARWAAAPVAGSAAGILRGPPLQPVAGGGSDGRPGAVPITDARRRWPAPPLRRAPAVRPRRGGPDRWRRAPHGPCPGHGMLQPRRSIL